MSSFESSDFEEKKEIMLKWHSSHDDNIVARWLDIHLKWPPDPQHQGEASYGDWFHS